MKTRARRNTHRYCLSLGITGLVLLLAGCGTLYYFPVEPAPVLPDYPTQPSAMRVMPGGLEGKALSQAEEEAIEVYRENNRAVVNVTSVLYRYNWFLQVVPMEGTGSGFIIDESGLVVTNYHVVKNADTLAVTLYDGAVFPAGVVGVDLENDLAVIGFDPGDRGLVAVRFGSSADLRIGQRVYALGNPFGLERTLTCGIISGLERPLQTPEGFIVQKLIQTDASINPGNSGGPLLDSRGRAVGVNTMILSPTGGSVGIGFAVPIEVVRRVLPDMIEFGTVRRGWIDIEPVGIFPILARGAGLPVETGILVSRVQPGSTAETAGLRGGSMRNSIKIGRTRAYLGGDIIVAVDGEGVDTMVDYFAALEGTRPGDVVTLSVLRSGGLLELSVELSERPPSFSW